MVVAEHSGICQVFLSFFYGDECWGRFISDSCYVVEDIDCWLQVRLQLFKIDILFVIQTENCKIKYYTFF